MLVKFWDLKAAMDLLSEREKDEAYLAAKEGEAYVVYFPEAGCVNLNLSNHDNNFSGKWINVKSGEWDGDFTITGGNYRQITTRNGDGWFAVLTSTD